MGKNQSILFILAMMSISTSFAEEERKSVEWTLIYTSDIARNFSGGIKRGNTYMGLVSAGFAINTDKLWDGGEFNFLAMNSHGKGLSSNYIGDLQVVSNIENGNYTFIELLYYKQNFSNSWVAIGLQDMNQEFVVSQLASNFINSSFGIPSTFPLNYAVPIYPKTGLGISVMYSITALSSVKIGLFDGNSGNLDEDKYNLKWKLNRKEGSLGIVEMDNTLSDKLRMVVGCMYVSANMPGIIDTSRIFHGSYGVYSLFDYQLYKNIDKEAGAFIQLAYHPQKCNFNQLYFGIGTIFKGFLFHRSDDQFGIGMAYARFIDKNYESDLEFNYNFNLGEHLSIMPNFHYVIHPAGVGIGNSFAAIVRIVLKIV
jgi:porin